MVQAIINISEQSNRVLNILKAKYGLKDKSDAIDRMAKEYGDLVLEPELQPGYVEKLRKIQRQKGIRFRTVEELRRRIEDA